jgi:hypothetical protein
MDIGGAQPRGSERGQVLIGALGAMFVVMLGAGVLTALGGALAQKGRLQRATDLAALSAARLMRDDFARLFEPLVIDGRPNPRHLSRAAYLSRARAAALEAGRHNGLDLTPGDVSFPGGDSGAPLRVKVEVKRRLPAGDRGNVPVTRPRPPSCRPRPATGSLWRRPVPATPAPLRTARASLCARMSRARSTAWTQPRATDGVRLIITSAYRSDAEQAELYERHPDPKWGAPPGKSLHRLGTELDLGPPSAYGWRTTPAASTSSKDIPGKNGTSSCH